MAKYKGKNSIRSPIRLFAERANFSLLAYNDFNYSPHIRDLAFGEYQMYGRIDHNMLPVIPQEEFLNFVYSPQEQQASVQALDFVAEAFQNVQAAFKNACLLNAIPQEDPYLSVINAIKGYEDPVENYRRYLEDILFIYHETYILEQYRRLEIITISDYVDHLAKYLKILSSNFPMTFSSWSKSKNSSIFASGLALSIANIQIDDDEAKFSEFMSNRAFPYYLNVTKQHGFNVSKNSPWILFADLDSPIMKQKHLQPKLLISKNVLFKRRFKPAHERDLDLLEEIITRNYNRFVALFPIEKKHNICNNNKLRYNIINRNRINSLSQEIPDRKLIRLYATMKNIEENNVFDKSDLDKIIKNGKKITKSFDRNRGISYINEKFRQTFKSKPGGINSIIQANKAFADLFSEE